MGSQKKADDRLARKVRVGQLLETYGALLTDRQREYVRLHQSEDMSLGEIAAEFGVSRQAVHDAVRQAEAAMENYEKALGLLAHAPGAGGQLPTAEPTGWVLAALAPAIEELESVRRRMASQGIIYDPDPYVRALDRVIERLRSQAGHSDGEP